jgi:hypothetical protein
VRTPDRTTERAGTLLPEKRVKTATIHAWASPDPARSYLAGQLAPPLILMADLLKWTPLPYGPLAWRDAYETHLESCVDASLTESREDGCLKESLSLLGEGTRRRFLRAPAVATMLRSHVGNQFDGRIFARLLLAELAASGLVDELPESLWTARGDRLLDQREPEDWTLAGIRLGDTDVAVDLASPFAFPDDEFGIAETAPHPSAETDIALRNVLDAVGAIRDACQPALALVILLIEVLAIRRAPAEATTFYSSTFPGCPGLVRLCNAHLQETGPAQIAEALVHESIHCILHVHEELERPFVCDAKASQAKITSPWTGATIRLQSYIHACAVWYGIYWLWSAVEFANPLWKAEIAVLKQRALRGFQFHPVSRGLAAFEHLLTKDVMEFLQDLEDRMFGAT